MVEPVSEKDLAGHIATVTRLPLEARKRPATPVSVKASELQHKTFKPIGWVVADFIPDGLTMLAGKPKIGKSWLVMDIAVAVAQGTYTMGERKCVEGDVLYAAPMMWHQMGAEAQSGPSVRLAMGAYELINMNNTAARQ